MRGSEGVARALHREEFSAGRARCSRQALTFDHVDGLVFLAVHDEPWYRDRAGRAFDVERVAVALDVLEHVKVQGKDLPGAGVGDRLDAGRAPRGALSIAPALDRADRRPGDERA